jgi:hypothetical protein
MTKKELIEALKEVPDDAVLHLCDQEFAEYHPVGGVIQDEVAVVDGKLRNSCKRQWDSFQGKWVEAPRKMIWAVYWRSE